MSENLHINVKPRQIEDEMKKSYIDYAMSVIVARALPDVRDGLKPVHRRILYAMNELHLEPSKGYRKSATITGETMGKFHPHGDSSIYDAMVRMAQNFSMRYMLVDGHGNFGSMDGDSPAAQRYTEARLSKMAVLMLKDIDKDTVDFIPNFDGEILEPTVLTSSFPNLLVNGSTGIAVGMSTNIPPHNLTEVINATVFCVENKINDLPKPSVDEVMQFIKAPDFPTGANILGTSGVREAYRTGRGKVVVRSECDIETDGNREQIVVSEIPYQVNKANLVAKIGELVKDKKVEGISDLRDESDRHGVRIVIELKRDANASLILNQLYKYTQLQESYGIIMLALVDNQPKILNLVEIIELYIKHQQEVINRKTTFDLNKALKRAHILEGYFAALDNIDKVISVIRSSKDSSEAKERLITEIIIDKKLSESFNVILDENLEVNNKLSIEQATAIIEMRLRALTGLERDKIMEEFEGLINDIKRYRSILGDEKVLLGVLKDDLISIVAKFGDERRSKILADPGEIINEDLIDEENCVITITNLNYIKRLPLNTYKAQNRGGKGIMGHSTRNEDDVKDIFIANSHDYIMFFTTKGKVFRLKTYEIAEASRTAKGTAIVNLLSLSSDEDIATTIPVPKNNQDDFIVFITKFGLIKKTQLKEFDRIQKNGKVSITLNDNDKLINVLKVSRGQDIFMVTTNGYGIRFKENALRSLGRQARGVRGITLKEHDTIVSAGIIKDDDKILFVTENGYGKCTVSNEFRVQNRAGKGLKIYKLTSKTGKIVGVTLVNDEDEIMLINSSGVIIRLKVNSISTTGRVTQGVKLINLKNDEIVINFTKISSEQLDSEIFDEVGEVIEDIKEENLTEDSISSEK